MSGASASAHWYRVADLRLRLRSHVTLRPQATRDRRWYVLGDGLQGRVHRVNEAAYQFIGRCDGQRSVGEIWSFLLDALPDSAPTQDEIIQLIGQLNQRGLLQASQTPDLAPLFQQARRERRQARLQAINPLSFRVGLVDPGPLLARCDGLARRLFSLPALLAWATVVVAALLVAADRWPALVAQGGAWLGQPRSLLVLGLCFVLMKALHEFAHGLAVRRWGGQVTRAGLTLFALMPIPFVDASDASGFPQRHQRMTVSAAGMLAETLLAGLALLLWSQVQPGLLSDILFSIAFIGGISTLAVNANPLLRYDGYFILTDLARLPNLQSRSTLFWRHLAIRHLLRGPEAAPEREPGELPWLVGYAPLSWAYRVALNVWIVLWLAEWSPLLGWLAALSAGWMLLVAPLHAFVLSLKRLPPATHSASPQRLALLWLLLIGIVLGAVPLPASTLAEGIVWPAENARLRVPESGFIEQFLVDDGAVVSAGEPIARLANRELAADIERLRQKLLGRETEFYQRLFADPVEASNIQADLERLRTDLAELEARQASLTLRAGVAGRVVLPGQHDRLGSHVERGMLLGHIVNGQPASIHVTLPQGAIAEVSEHTRAIAVRLREAPFTTLPASMPRSQPAATTQLPSAALGEWAGGPHPVDGSDEQHRQLSEPVFVVELSLAEARPAALGGRAWVRFEHPPAPLLMQWGRQLRQLLLGSGLVGG